jgi:hypothetical protein
MSQELLTFLNKLHDQSLELAGNLTFDKSFEKDGMIVCLYGSLVELCGGLIVLIEKDRKSSVSCVFRTFLEAYVDFKNVLEDADYVKHCMAKHHQHWLRILKNSDDPNPYLDQIKNHPEFDATIKRHESSLKKLKDEGFKPLQVLSRFQKAGMEEEYRSIYAFESDGSHNSVQAMISRHLEVGENDFGLAFYKENKLEDYLTYLDSAVGLLMDATLNLHERLKGTSKNHPILV